MLDFFCYFPMLVPFLIYIRLLGTNRSTEWEARLSINGAREMP